MNSKALLIGINYEGTGMSLRGCINDVESIREFLVNERGYKIENITMLTDHTDIKPTRSNIVRAIADLISSNADELWFHYSGHGVSLKDRDGDEEDGRDEGIVPLDVWQEGIIRDDFLKSLFTIRDSQKLRAIFDCCHSGTILDISAESSGNVLCLSGCLDSQKASDTKIESKWCGALTNSFLACYNSFIPCYTLVKNMTDYLSILGYSQIPQLEHSRQATIYF